MDDRGCWEWVGALDDNGYGRFYVRKNHSPHASRVAWELCFGPIPGKLFVCHRCDNPPCVNPAHLFLGTRQDNILDCVRKGRHRQPYTQHGLAHHTAFGKSKVREIEKLLSSGLSQEKAARKLGISQGVVSRVSRGCHWTQLVKLDKDVA